MIHHHIGEIFKEMDTIGDEQLEAALHVQKASGAKLGELLVKLNFVTFSELAHAIALQKGLEYIELENHVPKKEALELVPKEFSLLNSLLPLEVEGDVLHVVTTSPDDEIDQYLQEITGKQIRFGISDALSIARFTQFYYDHLQEPIETKIEQIIKETMAEEEVDIIELADLIINNAIKERATDIHIVPERLSSHIFYRIDGVLNLYYSLPNQLHPHLVLRLKALSKLDIVENFQPQSGEFTFNFLQTDYNIRISAIPTIKGEKVALRLLPENFTLYNLESLGFEKQMINDLERILKKSSGIILIIGPSGSGKTSTLYALLRKINILQRNVLSIEDPVEFQLPFVNQLEVNLKTDFTFTKGLHHIARQDPDVIVVGEILDEETAKLVVRNSATGHLILSSISGSRSASTITRLKDLNVDRYMLSDGLIAIVSQKLVRRLCPHCKEPVSISKETLSSEFPQSTHNFIDDATIYHPIGCEHCKQSGYLGRIALAELFEVDKQIRHMIESDQSSQQIEDYVKEAGMKSFEDDALLKVLNGDCSLEEVKRVID